MKEIFHPKSLQELGDLLRKRRKELGITQKELAKYCNLSHTGIGRVELGQNDVKFETLLKLSTFLGFEFSITMDE